MAATGMTAPSLKRERCDSCSEPIYWVRTKTGKRMPIDVEPVPHGNLLLAAAEIPPRVSVVSKAGRAPGTKLYLSHFASCRYANQHRRDRARRTPRHKPHCSASRDGER